MGAIAMNTKRAHGMVWLEGGAFRMGSDAHYPEEAPSRRVVVGGFWIDAMPVTNAQFAEFVRQTHYVSVAERPPNAALYPGMLAELAHPGSLVFAGPDQPTKFNDATAWWSYCLGANWRSPLGPGTDIERLADHPVVHVAYADAEAYAAWAGKALPTEAEWEFAARGGLEGATFSWGEELAPGGQMLANYWQGEFPWQHLLTDGYARTSPVGSFPANAFGLFDMIGNVWDGPAIGSAFPDRTASRAPAVRHATRSGRAKSTVSTQRPQRSVSVARC